jgi:hypothetical protein
MARPIPGLCGSGSRISGAGADSYTADGVVGWHMDDLELAFPIFQRALDLGLKAIAIHKAIPLGPVPMDHYRRTLSAHN